MSAAPHLPGPAPLPPREPREWPAAAVSPRQIARRRLLVTWSKRLLPLAALALLAATALWPDIDPAGKGTRMTFRAADGVTTTGDSMRGARYRSVTAAGEPFTLTAARAVQAGEGTVRLFRPKGDITLKSGAWLTLQAATGLYHQRSRTLDLATRVTLYRDDGTRLTTSSAAIDLAGGTATGKEPTRASGPFGTLTATGFTVRDQGAVIDFTGPTRLVLDGAG
ncbi:MAG: LPS export ABC transporter periplasmic protein LptC [Acetobacteraceae bacterium]